MVRELVVNGAGQGGNALGRHLIERWNDIREPCHVHIYDPKDFKAELLAGELRFNGIPAEFCAESASRHSDADIVTANRDSGDLSVLDKLQEDDTMDTVTVVKKKNRPYTFKKS